MQTNNKMAVAPVGKLIWQMSIPPLISMFRWKAHLANVDTAADLHVPAIFL